MGRDIFLYGTLRDPDQLRAVLGHGDADLSPGTLPDHRVAAEARKGSFPLLLASPGSQAEGRVLRPTREEAARLDWYEAIFGYHRRTVRLASGAAADVYWPQRAEAGETDWDLAAWRAEWGEAVALAAAEVMLEFPGTPPGDLGARYGMHLARATSALRAGRERPHGAVRQGAGRKGVTLTRRVPRHRGFFALDELHIDHRRFDGGRAPVVREVFVSTDATLVLPYDPVRDLVVLVEQFRAGPYRRGDPNPWCLEPVAGLIDAGESPEDTAHREAEEEAGLRFSSLVPVPGGYPSPGATAEYYHLFVGLADLEAYRPVTAGLAAEGEDILTHVLKLDAALALLGSGEAPVLPLAYLLTWTALHRETLRTAAP